MRHRRGSSYGTERNILLNNSQSLVTRSRDIVCTAWGAIRQGYQVTCYSTALTAIGHAKYRHRLYRVGRDKARLSKFYHRSPYAYCAGDPVNLVDPDGRKIMISDGTNMYIWMEHNGVWGFYDNDGNLYSGDTEYMNEYSNALIELSSTNTGYYIVSTLANDESFDVTLFSIPSLGNKYSSDAPSINWNYKTEYLKYIPTTNGPQKNIITSLGHELAHAVFQRDGGDFKKTWEVFPGIKISISEIYTTHIENKIRSERG